MVLVSSSVVSLGPFFYISSSDRSRDGRAILREQVVLLLIRVRICSVPRLRGEDVSMSILLQAKNSYSIGKKYRLLNVFLAKKHDVISCGYFTTHFRWVKESHPLSEVKFSKWIRAISGYLTTVKKRRFYAVYLHWFKNTLKEKNFRSVPHLVGWKNVSIQ